MKRSQMLRSVTRLLTLVFAALLVTACAGGGTAKSTAPQKLPSAFAPITQPLDFYEDQADDAEGDALFVWQMQLAQAYLTNKDLAKAEASYRALAPLVKTEARKAQYQLLEAAILAAKGDNSRALTLLAQKPTVALDGDSDRAWYQLQAKLQQQAGDVIGEAKSLILLDPFLTEMGQKANHSQIWTLLQSQTPSFLTDLVVMPAPDVTSGWLELAVIAQQYGNNPTQLARQVQSWLRRYPNHPAVHDMPLELSQAAMTPLEGSLQVAALLPLSGNGAAQGEALRSGMLAAYKQRGFQFKLKFYDTQGTPIVAVYQKAVSEGADTIIGPLLKPDVQAIIDLKPSVTTLALNAPDQVAMIDKLYYFSLSAAADAAQSAHYLYEQGYQQPLLIAAQDRVGIAGQQAFIAEWNKLSVNPPVVAAYYSREEIQGAVKRAIDGGAVRAGVVKSVASVESEQPQHNTFNGIDVAYIIATPADTRIIKPYIDINVSQAQGGLATYVGARGFGGTSTEVLPELNGLHISDMPLLLGEYDDIKSEVQTLWPELRGDRLRLFAMGFDALSLTQQLPQMGGATMISIPGLTGDLAIDERNMVQRQLSWATYQNGLLIDETAQTTIEEMPAVEESNNVPSQDNLNVVPTSPQPAANADVSAAGSAL